MAVLSQKDFEMGDDGDWNLGLPKWHRQNIILWTLGSFIRSYPKRVLDVLLLVTVSSGTRRSSDPTSHICHRVAPALLLLLLLLLKSKSETEHFTRSFTRDLSPGLKTWDYLECKVNFWGRSILKREQPFKYFPKPEEFLSGLVC